MAQVNVTLSKHSFVTILGEENADKLPESVIRDAESGVERYLLGHSEEFHEAIRNAVGNALEENSKLLLEAGIDLYGENEADEDAEAQSIH